MKMALKINLVDITALINIGKSQNSYIAFFACIFIFSLSQAILSNKKIYVFLYWLQMCVIMSSTLSLCLSLAYKFTTAPSSSSSSSSLDSLCSLLCSECHSRYFLALMPMYFVQHWPINDYMAPFFALCSIYALFRSLFFPFHFPFVSLRIGFLFSFVYVFVWYPLNGIKSVYKK